MSASCSSKRKSGPNLVQPCEKTSFHVLMFHQSTLPPQCEMEMQTLLLLSYIGPLMGEGAHCRLSSLRNGNVPCQYFLNIPVDFKVVQCCLSNIRKCHVALSNLRVKGPLYGTHCVTTNVPSYQSRVHQRQIVCKDKLLSYYSLITYAVSLYMT